MTHSLSLRDLTLPGEPLDSAELLTGEEGLQSAVSWAVSLRSYSPAFPRLRGGELALVATENLARLDPPITLGDVVRLLSSTGAAVLAVRGEIDPAAVQIAHEMHLPLFALPPDAPLADIEQAVMRECALHQARSEIRPSQEPDAWFEELLSSRASVHEGAAVKAERQGYLVSAHYYLVFLVPMPSRTTGQPSRNAELHRVVERLQEASANKGEKPVAVRTGGGLAILLPAVQSSPGSGKLESAIAELGGSLACGIATATSLLAVAIALANAQLAATASAHIYNGAVTRYDELGALRLLLLLRRDQTGELASFVQENIRSLLKHDAQSSVPLLPTIRAFLEHGGHLRETAGALFVHRNTLAYRLERASEILGVDLKEPGARLAVELALLALPLLDTSNDL